MGFSLKELACRLIGWSFANPVLSLKVPKVAEAVAGQVVIIAASAAAACGVLGCCLNMRYLVSFFTRFGEKKEIGIPATKTPKRSIQVKKHFDLWQSRFRPQKFLQEPKGLDSKFSIRNEKAKVWWTNEGSHFLQLVVDFGNQVARDHYNLG